MDEPYHIGFIADETPSPRMLHERCLDAGLATTHDGRADICREYRIGSERNQDEQIESALSALEDADSGYVHYWTGADMMLRVGFTRASTKLEEKWGRANIGFQTSEIDWGGHEKSAYRSRIENLLDLVEALVPVVDPEYVWSGVYMEGVLPENVMPDGRPIPDHIDDPSWITVVSEPVIEEFGGREHVLGTPAWRTTEFDTGHVMLVLEDHPYDPEEPVEGSATEHLLGE